MDSVEERDAGLGKGKGLFANTNFALNEVIFDENALVSCQFAWNEDCNYPACEYCLLPLETPEENARRLTGDHSLVLPFPEIYSIEKSQHQKCESCPAKYCSTRCLTTAKEQYHDTLCFGKAPNASSLRTLREKWKKMQYPPESFNVMIVAKLAAIYKQRDEVGRQKLMNDLGKFEHGTSSESGALLKILGHKWQDHVLNLRSLFADCFNDPCFSGWWDTSNFIQLLAVFARNAQGVGTSAFGMWQTLLRSSPHWNENVDQLVSTIYAAIEEKTGMDFMDNEGSALYVRQRACNHSCDPNAKIVFPFNNSTCRLVATKPIPVGSEVLISYFDDCQLNSSRHTRRKILREFYLFDCSCTKCQEQASDPDVSSEEEEDQWTDEDEAMEES